MATERRIKNFDHFFGGTIVNNNQLRQNYAKQETKNNTISNSFVLNKELEFENFKHNFTLGYDNSIEKREPKLWYNRNFTATINPYSRSFNAPRYNTLSTHNRHKAISNGVFFDDLISFNDKYKILLGGRFDFYKFQTDNEITGNNTSYKGHTFSPRIGLLWDFLPDHTAYISYSKSFSPYGGRGIISLSEDLDKVDIKPQHNIQYEIGLKDNWLDNTINTNLAFFYIEHKNIMYRPDKDDPYTWAQRGKEESSGVELNVLGEIYKNLYLRSSVGYLKTKIVGDKQQPLNEGLPLNDTTKWQGNVFLRYVNNEKWYLESGVTAYSKRYNYSVSNGVLRDNSIPGFMRVDMSGGYNFNKNTQVTLAVNNVLNKKYWRSSARPGDERSFMLNLHYNF